VDPDDQGEGPLARDRDVQVELLPFVPARDIGGLCKSSRLAETGRGFGRLLRARGISAPG
jgi:hypothetical protein